MKVVVLGAGGLLGAHLVEELRGESVTALDRKACDVSDAKQVLDGTAGAELILNCAAYTNVDGAEREPAAAEQANAVGAENVARAALAHGAKWVHVSTDFVFDGRQAEPYDELDAPRPLSVYARTKWEGEERARAVGGRLFLARVQGLYGRGGRNFASRLRELLLAGGPKRLRLDGERRVQPTWARAAARQLLALARTEAYGTYHVSCHGETTWAAFTGALAERLGVAPSWDEVPSAALDAPAPRPPNCLFRHRRLAETGLDQMPDWRVALDGYLAEAASS